MRWLASTADLLDAPVLDWRVPVLVVTSLVAVGLLVTSLATSPLGRESPAALLRTEDRADPDWSGMTPRACEPGRMTWFWVSLIGSIVLTLVVNVALRTMPGAGDRLVRRLESPAEPSEPSGDRFGSPERFGSSRVKVYFPWKAMLVASVVLTIMLNLVVR